MEDKKYSLGEFTFDTQQEYERAKVELQVILKIKQKYDINNPEDAKNVLDAVNKKEMCLSHQLEKHLLIS
jgi:hypothetical protein